MERFFIWLGLDSLNRDNTDILVRICRALNCDIGDIAEIVLQESKAE